MRCRKEKAEKAKGARQAQASVVGSAVANINKEVVQRRAKVQAKATAALYVALIAIKRIAQTKVKLVRAKERERTPKEKAQGSAKVKERVWPR